MTGGIFGVVLDNSAWKQIQPRNRAMLNIYGDGAKYCDGLTRRSFLKIGGLAMGGMSLAEILRAEAHAGRQRWMVLG